jgi:hypothetical protein
VVAHTGSCQAFRYWLKGPKAGQYELFTDLPGYPDNVRRDVQGGFWVALNQEKRQLNAMAPIKHLVGVRLDADGAQVEELTAARGVTLRACLLLRYFHPQKMWGYVGIWCSPNTLQSPQIPSPKILYHDGEFLI